MAGAYTDASAQTSCDDAFLPSTRTHFYSLYPPQRKSVSPRTLTFNHQSPSSNPKDGRKRHTRAVDLALTGVRTVCGRSGFLASAFNHYSLAPPCDQTNVDRGSHKHSRRAPLHSPIY